MDTVTVRTIEKKDLESFFLEHDFFVEKVTDKVLKVHRSDEHDVYINYRDNTLFFEIDLGSAADVMDQNLLVKLLDLNTEILPVSIGIDSTSTEDRRLVLVESRECSNIDSNELLAVMDALEIAVDKVAIVLQKHFEK